MQYTIKEVSQKTGLSQSTLRYYEKEGLLSPVKRDKLGKRVYDEDTMEYLSCILCLKNTGMPNKEIKTFVTLLRKGDATLEERRQMVLTQKEIVESKIAALTASMNAINAKLEYYNHLCQK